MKISLWDKLNVLLRVYGCLPLLPEKKKLIHRIINPIDSTRYVEFAYLLKWMEKLGINNDYVLDVSSPYMMANILSRKGKVVKTDINMAEQRNIKQSRNLEFRREDATSLSFGDNMFDLVYSISVVEHIYERYTDAIKEMIRVLKPGGYLYLTFPVSLGHVEEWIEDTVYSDQFSLDGKFFFQYRFSEDDLNAMLSQLLNVAVIDSSIYWERSAGRYDSVMGSSKKNPSIHQLTSLRDGYVNFKAGLNLLDETPGDFTVAKSFGNMSILLKKLSSGDELAND